MPLIPIGRLTVATPETMAASIRGNTVATDAVDERIQDVAVDIITDNPAVVAAATAAAADAVDAELSSANVLQAFPSEDATYSGSAAVPMRWVHKTLNDPVGDAVGDTIAGGWTGTAVRRGDVPVLSAAGKLNASQVPDSFATRTYVDSAVASIVIPDSATPAGRVVRQEYPVFGARVAAGREANQPIAVVYAGSSTTARQPSYVARLTAMLQELFPGPAKTYPQWDISANFTERTTPGIHGYSAGEGGARSDNYLTDEESDKVAALKPALIVHMVGANDYHRSVPVATYKAQMIARLNYLDSVLTVPCQHMLVQPYPRAGLPGPDRYEFPWDEYGEALDEIAATRTDTTYLDISDAYAAVGVTVTDRSDPLDLIDPDDTHMTANGYRFMADLLTASLTA